MRICEPCIFRCHKGHKGIRFIRESQTTCICDAICKNVNDFCKACVISETQRNVQREADNHRQEQRRHRQLNIDMPPIISLVPRIDPATGSIKSVSGWIICRQVYPEPIIIEPKLKVAADSDDDLDSLDHESLPEFNKDNQDVLANVAYNSKFDTDTESIAPMEVPSGWIEIYDCEEPKDLVFGDRVLCLRHVGIPRMYGSVKSCVKSGFYKIRFDDRTIDDEVLHRSKLEMLSRKKFYFCQSKGESAWTIDQINNDKTFKSETLVLPGAEWLQFNMVAGLRRGFHEFDEMFHPYANLTYYSSIEDFRRLKAVLTIQKLYRTKFARALPLNDWLCTCFTFDVPESVSEEMLERAGWAYLRRRSRGIGEFQDIDGIEWEEYMDSTSFEYFYWEEESNKYSWIKPELFSKRINTENYFKVGEEIMFRFPGRRAEEIATIHKLRFDDATGADMYDIKHKYNADLICKWIPRIQIKQVLKEGDALKLSIMEKQWKRTIKKKRELDEKKAKQEKQRRIQEELARLEQIKSMSFRSGGSKGEEVEVNQTTRLMRNRILRINLELDEVRQELDEVEGKKRREFVREQIADLQRASGGKLSRGDILTMTRSLDLKLQLEDKVNKRNALQKELNKCKIENKERAIFVEEGLQKMEVHMTTPRSLMRSN